MLGDKKYFVFMFSNYLVAVLRIWDEQPGSYFRELKKHFFGFKYFNSLMRIRDGKIRIRDLGRKKFGTWINIPDLQHWLVVLVAW